MANGNFGGGNGTIQNPYLIEDALDLNAVRNGTNYYNHFKLVKDIDMRSYNNSLDATGWTPIPEFRGSIDGDGFVISNFYINRSATEQAFIVDMYRATIRNLGFAVAYVNGGTATTNTGASIMAVRMNTIECLIENCFVTGQLTGYSNFGAIVGKCTLGTVKNCHVDIKLNGSTGSNYGGCVGSVTNGKVINCLGMGMIGAGTNTLSTAGMVVGSATTSTVTSCYGVDTGHGVVGGGGTNSRKSLVDLVNPVTYVGWNTVDYDFNSKLWVFIPNDTPKLVFQTRVKYIIKAGNEYYGFEPKDQVFVALGTSMPSDNEFVRLGICKHELVMIPKIRYQSFREHGSFELISLADKTKMNFTKTLLTLSQDSFISDGVIMKGTIDFNLLGDKISRMDIQY